jgi:hypothetical protein
LAVVAVVDVDGDPTTSNVTSIVLAESRAAAELQVDERLRAPAKRPSHRARPPRVMSGLWRRARNIWDCCTPPIRGP